MNTENKKVILIVCRGNIVRSPFAEAVVNHEFIKRNLQKEFVAISRGTQGTLVDPIPVKFPNITFYKKEYRFARPTLGKFKIDITRHISKPIDIKTAEGSNIIFAVDEVNKTALIKLFPNLKNKIYKLSELVNINKDFTDPENLKGTNKHSQILSEIHDTILRGFPKLLVLANKAVKS